MHSGSIGPFKIERELGSGGMGEVFLAHDTRLDREVAIKALPAHLAQDPDRLARFQREAKVLASLNHPNIGAIYGLEESDGHQYLILEFVEGETLATRLVSGALPTQEALSIAKQIAEALEVAHEKGVIHRDLKPGNVMVTNDGVVKVLDFGLARTQEGPASSSSTPTARDSPTVTAPALAHSPTIPGAILGTAGYMSPEQARGKPVDKRSDIFSFGCVLYEMLTGVGPFPGESVTDSLGAILHREPDWELVPPQTPARVRELLRKCLAKDRRNRQQDIGDARLDLDRSITGQEWTATATNSAARKSPAWLLPVGVACGIALLAAGWGLGRMLNRSTPSAEPAPLYVSATLKKQPALNSLAGIAPDARFLVYTATSDLPPDSVKPEGLLAVRRLDRDQTTLIEGSEGAIDAALSPDGRWIAFSCAQDRSRSRISLKKVALDNGRPLGKPETICELSQTAWPIMCWSSDREIVFRPSWEPTVYAVSASGGEPRVVLREDFPKGIEAWGALRPLVAGKSILSSRWILDGQKFRLKTEVIDLASGERTLVLPDAGLTLYLPDENGGYLLAMRSTQTSLVAARFDLETLRTVGEPVTVWSGNPISAFYAAPDGTLAITTRPAEVLDRSLAWIDDKGQSQPIPGMIRSYGQIVVSPDGGRVLADIERAGTAEVNSECWVQDLSRRMSTRLPVQGAATGMIWSNDGQEIAYGLAKEGGFSMWKQRSDGSGEPVKLYSSPDSRTLLYPSVWTPDGQRLAFSQFDLTADATDAYLLEQQAGSGEWVAKPYLKTPANDDIASFSPDGKWVLLRSSRSGRSELYVQRFTGDADADAGLRQVSTSGASWRGAWWSPDGQEIRYLDMDGQVMSVQVTTEPAFSAAEPRVLYSINELKTRSVTFGPDGRLLAVIQGESEQTTTTVDLILNFLVELRGRMALAK